MILKKNSLSNVTPVTRDLGLPLRRTASQWPLQAVLLQTLNLNPNTQIEKEMLAVVFALQRFDQYVYGRTVTVQSDYKPLAGISMKPLRIAPKGLQWMLLKFQKYDVTIVYKPGPKMHLADTLSSAFLPTTKDTEGEFKRVNAAKRLAMTDERFQGLRTSTREDEVLKQLKEVIHTG